MSSCMLKLIFFGESCLVLPTWVNGSAALVYPAVAFTTHVLPHRERESCGKKFISAHWLSDCIPVGLALIFVVRLQVKQYCGLDMAARVDLSFRIVEVIQQNLRLYWYSSGFLVCFFPSFSLYTVRECTAYVGFFDYFLLCTIMLINLVPKRHPVDDWIKKCWLNVQHLSYLLFLLKELKGFPKWNVAYKVTSSGSSWWGPCVTPLDTPGVFIVWIIFLCPLLLSSQHCFLSLLDFLSVLITLVSFSQI